MLMVGSLFLASYVYSVILIKIKEGKNCVNGEHKSSVDIVSWLTRGGIS